MMQRLLVLVVTVLAGVATPSAAKAAPAWHRIECPASIPQEAMTAPKAPRGWKAFVGGPAHLQRIDLYLGSPDQLRWIRPQDGPQGKQSSSELWQDLQKERGQTTLPDRSVWLACVYGRHGSTVLGKRLDDMVSECKATYRQLAQDEFGIDFQCKW